ncbi:hypothetical protein L3Q82_007114 [Scortum barcoo]|uniref:Uncharacterized protein n=1 Tax=Scortum barcoo TaxID=214431 RepID=A0ACB8WSM6_9TELE|nr:hypothetical protein L3Q82_007114 [Scortum barcoo]
MFFDFSSAFNTIQPRLLWDKLQLAGVDHHHLTTWISGLPHSHRPQFVRKFSDDSAVVGLITDGDDREYRGLIQDFADWCLRNNLQINAGKTKELVVDFRTGVDTLRLHRDLSSGPFYDSVVASAIFYGIVCWASSITDRQGQEEENDRQTDNNSSVLCCVWIQCEFT